MLPCRVSSLHRTFQQLFFPCVQVLTLVYSGLATLGIDVSIVSTGGVNTKSNQGENKDFIRL